MGSVIQGIIDLVIDLPELQGPAATFLATAIKSLKPDAVEQKAVKDLLTSVAAGL